MAIHHRIISKCRKAEKANPSIKSAMAVFEAGITTIDKLRVFVAIGVTIDKLGYATVSTVMEEDLHRSNKDRGFVVSNISYFITAPRSRKSKHSKSLLKYNGDKTKGVTNAHCHLVFTRHGLKLWALLKVQNPV